MDRAFLSRFSEPPTTDKATCIKIYLCLHAKKYTRFLILPSTEDCEPFCDIGDPFPSHILCHCLLSFDSFNSNPIQSNPFCSVPSKYTPYNQSTHPFINRFDLF
mmetsp:Transcript_89541/g.182619  ORF Transcript_89541/g.182619 Transcript_89541/m.182619 type:complete len:104 (+) Transcript_89541:148-459(+)